MSSIDWITVYRHHVCYRWITVCWGRSSVCWELGSGGFSTQHSHKSTFPTHPGVDPVLGQCSLPVTPKGVKKMSWDELRHSLRFRTMISCCFSKSGFINVTLSNFCAKGGWRLVVICQDFLFRCYYLKDMKYPFESKGEIISAVPFWASHDVWPSSRWGLTREPRLILLSPHLHPACACTPAKSSPLSLGSLAASPLALLAHRVLSPFWGGWTEGRTRHHSKLCNILG